MKTLAAFVVLCAGALAGCGGLNIQAPPNVGPLLDISQPTTFCLSAAPGGAVAIGWDVLDEDTGSPAATIRSVQLANPTGLRLVGALVVPVRSDAPLGNGWSYPLTAKEVSEVGQGVQWSLRRPAVGAVVSPGAPDKGVNLVVGVATTAAGVGRATGLTVSYTAGGHGYQITLPTHVTVDALPAHC